MPLTQAEAAKLGRLAARVSRLSYAEGVQEAGEGDGPVLDRRRLRVKIAEQQLREYVRSLTV